MGRSHEGHPARVRGRRGRRARWSSGWRSRAATTASSSSTRTSRARGARSRTSTSGAPTSSPTWWRRSRARRLREGHVHRGHRGARQGRPGQPSATCRTRQEMQQFQAAQDGLSSALSRLLVVVEKYPELKATAELPRPAGPARGDREPDRRRAQALQRDRAGVQHGAPALPDRVLRRHPRASRSGRTSRPRRAPTSRRR